MPPTVFIRLQQLSSASRGFTLAEVLITLGIIGVVSAITITMLMTNYQRTRDVNILKKQYSELSQAFRSASQEYDLYSSTPKEIVDALKPHIKWSGTFENSQYDALKAMCYNPNRQYWGGRKVKRNGGYLWQGGNCGISNPIAEVRASMELHNGACVGFGPRHEIILDTNGSYTLPNIVGKDVFIFEVNNKNGIEPKGKNLSDCAVKTGGNGCNKTLKNCGAGMYCAARILREGWQINYY